MSGVFFTGTCSFWFSPGLFGPFKLMGDFKAFGADLVADETAMGFGVGFDVCELVLPGSRSAGFWSFPPFDSVAFVVWGCDSLAFSGEDSLVPFAAGAADVSGFELG